MEENSIIKEEISSLGIKRHNIVGDIAHLRDAFLNAEREYVLELLKKDYIIEMIRECNQINPEVLYKKASKITEDVEYGLVADEDMEKAEQKLTVLLAAISDKVLLKMLTYYRSNSEEEHISHSR